MKKLELEFSFEKLQEIFSDNLSVREKEIYDIILNNNKSFFNTEIYWFSFLPIIITEIFKKFLCDNISNELLVNIGQSIIDKNIEITTYIRSNYIGSSKIQDEYIRSLINIKLLDHCNISNDNKIKIALLYNG